jgi:hypothetical protein
MKGNVIARSPSGDEAILSMTGIASPFRLRLRRSQAGLTMMEWIELISYAENFLWTIIFLESKI